MTPFVKRVVIPLLLAAGCLVLVALMVFVVWRFRLANGVDRQLAAIRAAGLPTNGEEANNYYPNVPDVENAAVER